MANTSDNQHVHDVITGAIARRSMLKVGGGALALTAIGGVAPAAAREGRGRGPKPGRGTNVSKLSKMRALGSRRCTETYAHLNQSRLIVGSRIGRWGCPGQGNHHEVRKF